VDPDIGEVLKAAQAQLAAQVPRLQADHVGARHSLNRLVGAIANQALGSIDSAAEHELRLLVDVAMLDFEIRTLVLRLLEAPEDRAVWEKYLVLAIWQALEEISPRIGPTLREAGREYAAAIKPVKADKEFAGEIADVRNRLVAHRSSEGPGAGHLEWATLALGSQELGLPAAATHLAQRAPLIARALHDLGSAVIRKHAALFPEAKV
jgi:hypothetical protein